MGEPTARDRAAGTAFDVLAADLLAVVKDWERIAHVLRGRPDEHVRVSEIARMYERHAEQVRDLIETPIFVDEPPVTDEQAREQAAAAMRRLSEVFDRHGDTVAATYATLFASQFTRGHWPALEAARALLGVPALPKEDRRG